MNLIPVEALLVALVCRKGINRYLKRSSLKKHQFLCEYLRQRLEPGVLSL